MTALRLLIFIGVFSVYCDSTAYVVHYEKAMIRDFNPELVSIEQFSYTKHNDTSLIFSARVTPLVDFQNDVMISFKMYKRENGEYQDYPLAFTSQACEIWNSLYNIKEMEKYGNMSACNVEKGKMMYVKDYVPNFTLPANLISGSFKSISQFTYHNVTLATVEAQITIDSPLDE